MNIISKIIVKLTSKLVGIDEFGNQYFLSRCKNNEGKNRRFVIYKGINEPSKVPANWHSWLHYYCNNINQVNELNKAKFPWQKIHLPNLTGTKNSFSPLKNNLNKIHQKTNKIYQSWQPK